MDQEIRNKLRSVVTTAQCVKQRSDIQGCAGGKCAVFAGERVTAGRKPVTSFDEERTARKDILDHFAHIKPVGSAKDALDR